MSKQTIVSPLDSAVFHASSLPSAFILHGRLAATNPAFRQTFPGSYDGATPLEAIPLLSNQPDFRAIVEHLPEGTAGREVRVTETSPGTRVFAVRTSPLPQPDGCSLLSFQDVTERERLAAELRLRVDALQRSNADLEQFAYVASHDLQEPLRMMGSYAQVLAETQRGNLDPDAQEAVAYIVDGATRMRQLVNDLLEYARVGPARGPLRPVAAGRAFDQARASLVHAIADTGANVSCGDLPVVMADEPQLVQVFQNLLSNALKFHGPEAPHIRVEARRSGAMWEFAVGDNGIGIDAKYFPRLFVLFHRLHQRTEFPGTGIGLALCKKIVELHGGRIWVDAVPGKGSTFRFTMQGVVA